MNKQSRRIGILAGVCIAIGVGSFGYRANTQTKSPVPNQARKEIAMSNHASGNFEVKMTPQAPADDQSKSAAVGKFSLENQFHGDLEATSKGEMLAVGTTVKGSAGYVAMEQVTGTLNGRSGAFALQHTGTMTRGAPQLSVTVVPDSGTGQLTGLAGPESRRHGRNAAPFL